MGKKSKKEKKKSRKRLRNLRRFYRRRGGTPRGSVWNLVGVLLALAAGAWFFFYSMFNMFGG